MATVNRQLPFRQGSNRNLYLGVSPGVPAVRFRSLDFMRGAGALAVVFAHALIAAPYFTIAGAWFALLVQHIFWLSATALPMFFVVSGFCIHLAQIRHEGVAQVSVCRVLAPAHVAALPDVLRGRVLLDRAVAVDVGGGKGRRAARALPGAARGVARRGLRYARPDAAWLSSGIRSAEQRTRHSGRWRAKSTCISCTRSSSSSVDGSRGTRSPGSWRRCQSRSN